MVIHGRLDGRQVVAALRAAVALAEAALEDAEREPEEGQDEEYAHFLQVDLQVYRLHRDASIPEAPPPPPPIVPLLLPQS